MARISIWRAGRAALAAAAVLVVLAGPAAAGATAATAHRDATATVSGTVADSKGRPLAGWSVSFYAGNPLNFTDLQTTVADSSGNYSVSLNTALAYGTAITPPGAPTLPHAHQAVGGGAGYIHVSGATTLDLTMAVIDVHVSVTDDHGVPVAGATVASAEQEIIPLVTPLTPGEPETLGDLFGQTATTDASGQATLTILADANPDPDPITVSPPSGSGLQGANLVVDTYTHDASLTAHLLPPQPMVAVSGTALTSKGAPLVNWHVAFMPAGDPGNATVASVDGSGNYSGNIPTNDDTVELFDGFSPMSSVQDMVRAGGLSLTGPTTLDLTESVVDVSVHAETSAHVPVESIDISSDGIASATAPVATGHLFAGSSGDVGAQLSVDGSTDASGNATIELLQTSAATTQLNSLAPAGYQSPAPVVVTPSADQPLNLTVLPWPTVEPGLGEVMAPSSGTVELDVPVTLSNPSTQIDPVVLHWTTVFSSGAPGHQAPTSDYTAASGTILFAPGQATATVPITASGNSTGHREYVAVVFNDDFGAQPGATIGFGVIDPTGTPTITPGLGSVVAPSSGTSELDVPVSLSAPSASTVTAHWHTTVVSGLSGQAPTSDYTAASGTVTFAPGQTSATVPITVSGDSSGQEELIVVSFTSAINAVLGGYLGLGFGIIEPAS
jgi:hypothetical protein